ncbi:MAG: alkaline phosphatase family protein [Chloroflexi bacterium]|nr:alkaline phosphatase family protein [Chloroflexota bacterium]
MALPTRLLLIGLDGASPTLLRRLLDQAHMPALAGLCANGTNTTLSSILPIATPAAWASIYTGVNPGRHGIVDFTDYVRGKTGSVLIDSSSIQSPAFWSVLSQSGQRVGLVGFPITYPPPPVNGFMISGLLTPSVTSPFAFPADLQKVIADIPGFAPEPLFLSPAAGFESAVVNLERHVETITTAALAAHRHCNRDQGWDLFGVQFQAVDNFQHLFWSWVDPADARFDTHPAAERARALAFYRVVDTCIHRLLETLQPDGVLVISDHGFGPVYEALSLNQHLLDAGLLQLSTSTARFKSLLWAQKTLKRLDVLNLRSRLRYAAMNDPIMGRLDKTFKDDLIDRQSSLAVNVSGGYCGIVQLQRADQALAARVRNTLMAMSHPKTRKPVIEDVYSAEQIFTGPCVDQLADLLIVKPMEGFLIDSRFRHQGLVALPSGGLTGTHRASGVLLSDHQLEVTSPSVLDIAPTVLSLLGVAAPPMDGHDLTGASATGHPPVTTNESLIASPYSPAETEEITRRLQQLGYL